MPNVTIALDDKLLRESRTYAKQHHTTLNRLIRNRLRESIGGNSAAWVGEMFRAMDKVKVAPHGKRWTREELYRV